MPKADHESLGEFLQAVSAEGASSDRDKFLVQSDRFVVSQLKAFYGTTATPQKRLCLRLHPKLPMTAEGALRNWSWAYIFDEMHPRPDGWFSVVG